MVLSSCQSGTFCEFRVGSLAGLGKASLPRPGHLPDHPAVTGLCSAGPSSGSCLVGLSLHCLAGTGPLSVSFVLSKMTRLGYRTNSLAVPVKVN